MLELNRESISSKVMCTNQFHGSMHGLLNTNVPLCQFCAFVFGCKISCFEVEFMKTLLCEEQCFEFAPTFANQLTFLSTTFRNISPLTHTQNIIALIFLFNIFLQQLKENLASVIFFVSRIFIHTSYLSFFLHKVLFGLNFSSHEGA